MDKPNTSPKKLFVVCCTTYNRTDFRAKSYVHAFFSDNNLIENTDYHVEYNNIAGLPKNYNRFISDKYKNCIVVFIHDDVNIGYHIKTLTRELNNAHYYFDVVGLAGAVDVQLKFPTLWHVMSTGKNSGSVCHGNKINAASTCFGASPAACTVVDGLFISVNVERLLNCNHKFDEQFTFHHYDIDFCLSAKTKNLKVGTWSIWVTHGSPGLLSLDNDNWRASNNLFCKKYNIL